jgi:hypothetical protein
METTANATIVTDPGHHVPRFETTTVCTIDPTKKGKSACKCKTTVRKLPESEETDVTETSTDQNECEDTSVPDCAEAAQTCSVKSHARTEEEWIAEIQACMDAEIKSSE